MFEMMDPYDDQDPADPPAPVHDPALIPEEDVAADDDALIPVDELTDDVWLDASLHDEAVQAVCDLEAELAVAGKLSWRRFAPIVKKAIVATDPPRALSDAEQAKANSGVFLCPEVEHGYATMIINARAGDVQALDQMLDLVARALKMLGDPDGPQQRRATAVGYLADPQATLDLLTHAETQRQADSHAAAARRAAHPDTDEVIPDAPEPVSDAAAPSRSGDPTGGRVCSRPRCCTTT